MRYTFENVKAVAAVNPINKNTGAVTSIAVDTDGFGDAVAVVQVGATTGTPDSFSVAAKVQESATGSGDWSDVTDATMVAVTTASKTGEIAVSLSKRAASKRYLQLVITPTFVGGTSPTVGVSGLFLLGNPERGSLVVNSATAN